MERNSNQVTQSQKMMIFVLSMSLYGLSTLFTELIPKLQVGIVEFSVEYFLFIPLTLGMLFHPLYTALGAATGEIVFSEIMLGQFGGLGEVEKFITLTIGLFMAGIIVRDAKSKSQIAIGSMVGVIVQQGLGCMVDILKVQFAVEDFEAVKGLPESVIFTEGFSFLNDVLFSGILFCLIPTLYLVPRLYGKIEPLLGMKPRDSKSDLSILTAIRPKHIILSVVFFLIALGSEFLAESGFSIIDWEASWAESNTALMVGIVIAFLVAIIVFIMMRKKADKISIQK
jgi:hypothetical protein